MESIPFALLAVVGDLVEFALRTLLSVRQTPFVGNVEANEAYTSNRLDFASWL
jgi:hypothetical protein